MMRTVVFQRDSLVPSPLASGADPIYSHLGNLVLALTLAGYPLSASITQLFGGGSSEINIAFRTLHILLSLSLFAMSLARKNFVLDKIVMAFFAMYTIRLWWDLSYSALPDITRDFQFYIAVTVIPVIAMAGSNLWYSERLTTLYIASIGGLAGILIYYNLATGPITAVQAEINQRATLELLNPISIGYHGLFIASAAAILFFRYRTLQTIILAVPIGILGLYLLIGSASRGPFVALLAGLVVIGLASRRANGVYAIAAAIIFALVSIFGLPEVIFNRFIEVGQDESSLQRIYTLELAIEHALQNPLLGYAYMEPITGRYPHNLIAEAGMALGLIGVVILGWMQISLLYNAWNAARNNQWFIPFIAGTMFANAWISGSLWGSALFFAILWLVRDQRRVGTIPANFNRT